MSRKMLKETIEPHGVPRWLPDRYPAFAISSSEPLLMFLAMATAVHGYMGGVESVLQDIFQKAGRAAESLSYLNELRKILD
jgi:hypothetical protein